MAIRACTIVPRDRIAFARVLASSWQAHHPGSPFAVFLLDDWQGFLDPSERFDVLGPADVGIPGFDRLADRLGPGELAEVVKPWLMRSLLEPGGAGHTVLYLDSRIRVYGPLVEADSAPHGGGSGAEVLLVPSMIRPVPDDGRYPANRDLRTAGAYNRGFLGLRPGTQTDRLLEWWAAGGDGGVWIDFLPAFFPVGIIRDVGYGVGYWNLHEREITRVQGSYSVSGRPLGFFHFAGYDPDAPHHLSLDQNRVQLYRQPAIRELCDRYRSELLAAGFEETSRWPSGTSRRSLGRQPPASRRSATAGLGPNIHGRRISTRIADLENLIDDLRLHDAGTAAIASEVARALNPLPRMRLGNQVARRFARKPEAGSVGVNVVGYLTGEVGIGEVARQASAALEASGMPVQPIGVPALHSRNGHAYPAGSLADARYPVNLVCFNADMFAGWRRAAGERFFRNRFTIGLWQWEVSTFPEHLVPAFAYVDEVWVGSEHIADALRDCSSTRVSRITIPVVPDAPSARDPGTISRPGGFKFLFVFDHLSVFERKNPLGLIWSFAEAFSPGTGASLLIKVINAEQRPEAHALLLAEARRHPDVHVHEGYLEPAEKNALIAGCDCYVSLHRGEGFGLTLAEAMYFGRPVIATGYSGNLDFMNPANSFLVNYSLTPIGPGADPYPADGEWAEPDLDHAAQFMRRVYEHRDEARTVGARAAQDIRRTHSHEAAGATMSRRLQEIIAAW